MKNIHLFETKNAFDAAKSSLILPRVSYIKENKDVKYNPTFDANGHEFVVIAGIKWATMNVGANSIADTGLYFQWGDTSGYTADQVTGDTEPKKAFSLGDYNINLMTKYNEKGMTLDLDDDAVHAAWGGSWRMPTKGEMRTVLNSTAVTKTWTSGYNGTSVAGYEIHDENSNETLFLPACGYALDGAVGNAGVGGDYWLSSLGSDGGSYAYHLRFSSADVLVYSGNRFYGRCVRGVLDKI